ncbi:MAG: hypothetical protein U0230_06135 [Polyangiales bacterium]
MSSRRCAAWAVLSAALLATVVLVPTSRVEAQTSTTTGAQVDATPKGTVGLGLIGAEIGLVVPALCGLDEVWSLITFPAVGGAGGAVAGYFLLDKPNHTNASVAMLVTGIALVMPAAVLTAFGVDRHRGDEFEQAAARARRVAMAGPGAFRLSEGRLMLGMPGVSVLPTLTPNEMQRYGGVAGNEVRFALFSGSF